ncbi:MAG TPA: hypothetical protein DDW51_26690 [Cyanobacteria bacterium UBA11367]|nr:hypothetical protein [Cyanobacteria bacterium UBA11367]
MNRNDLKQYRELRQKFLNEIQDKNIENSRRHLKVICRDFVQNFWAGEKEGLVILLKNWQEDEKQQNRQKNIQAEFNKIDLDNCSLTGMSNFVKNNLENDLIKTDNLGDISDIYCFYLNVRSEDKPVDEDAILHEDGEIRICKIWINWFLPVYYIECSSLKGHHQGKWLEFQKIIPENDEFLLVKNIEEVLIKLRYKKLDSDDLEEIIPEVTTDCTDIGEATLFNCLFSDVHLPLKSNHYIQTQQPLLNPGDMLSFFKPKKGEKYFVIEQVFDENGESILTRRVVDKL